MIDEEPYEPLAAQVRALLRDADELDLALAMMNQARIRSTPIDTTQVIHLLRIGWRAGWEAALDHVARMAEAENAP
jgi:hypothetical protein